MTLNWLPSQDYLHGGSVVARRKIVGSDNPASLNYAKIVYKLLATPAGWDAKHLMDELGISERTYRHCGF